MRKSKKPEIILSSDDKLYLQQIANSRTKPVREVNRAKVILAYTENNNITKISKDYKISRDSIYEYIDRALAIGAREALKDKYHRPKEPEITTEAKFWVTSIACIKPKELGYAAELWSYSKLAKYVRNNCEQKGYSCLNKAVKATVFRILNDVKIKPHKIKYYLEKRDENFDEKMAEILCVYKEIEIQNEKMKKGERLEVITLSIDEKPGIQAIKNIAEDATPKLGVRRSIHRDYEYKRLGTVSLLAALDLHTGEIIGQVHNRHRSIEFIELLKEIDSKYASDIKIRIILDNHSIHISKATQKYLLTVPNRFVYVHTPKHGSWLNLVEALFSKMARTFLKQIRVNSKEELKERILQGIKELNEIPVVFKWNKYDFNMSEF